MTSTMTLTIFSSKGWFALNAIAEKASKKRNFPPRFQIFRFPLAFSDDRF